MRASALLRQRQRAAPGTNKLLCPYTVPTHCAPACTRRAFACAATTIAAGAVAERMNFLVYVGYAALMPAWVYPVLTHWTWSEKGWLSAAK